MKVTNGESAKARNRFEWKKVIPKKKLTFAPLSKTMVDKGKTVILGQNLVANNFDALAECNEEFLGTRNEREIEEGEILKTSELLNKSFSASESNRNCFTVETSCSRINVQVNSEGNDMQQDKIEGVSELQVNKVIKRNAQHLDTEKLCADNDLTMSPTTMVLEC